MSTCVRRFAVGISMLVLCVTGWLAAGALAAPASADPGGLLVDVPGDGVGFTHDPSAAGMSFLDLAPGISKVQDLQVRNDSLYAAELRLTARDVVSHENSCERPEQRASDEDCADGAGELPAWLEIGVDRTDTGESLWRGTLSDLESGAVLSESFPAGATWPLRLTVGLPWEAPNETMSDSVGFGLRLGAESAEGTSEVAAPGIAVGSGGADGRLGVGGPGTRGGLLGGFAGGPRVGLPGTGATVSLWMLLLDAGVLATGLALVLFARRGRRHERGGDHEQVAALGRHGADRRLVLGRSF